MNYRGIGLLAIACSVGGCVDVGLDEGSQELAEAGGGEAANSYTIDRVGHLSFVYDNAGKLINGGPRFHVARFTIQNYWGFAEGPGGELTDLGGKPLGPVTIHKLAEGQALRIWGDFSKTTYPDLTKLSVTWSALMSDCKWRADKPGEIYWFHDCTMAQSLPPPDDTRLAPAGGVTLLVTIVYGQPTAIDGTANRDD